jgi:hypothetical protein
MSSNHAEEPTEHDVSRLTDDQARAIVVSGMPEDLWEQRPRRESRRPDQDRRRRLEHSARAEWARTPEAAKIRRRYGVLFIASIVVFVGTACATFTLIVFARVSWHIWSPVPFAGLIIDIFLMALGLVAVVGLRSDYEAYLDRYVANAERQDLTKRSKVSGKAALVPEKWLSDPDLQNLLLVNRTQLNVYQEIATDDAKAASRNSRFAITIGFLILLVGAAVAIRTPDSTSKIVVGALASIGSVLSGYIGQTFLKAQAQAMKQLNYYFRQPLVASYLLSAERIALKLGDVDSTKKALLDVIKNVLIAANRSEELDSTSSDMQRRRLRRPSNAAQAGTD